MRPKVTIRWTIFRVEIGGKPIASFLEFADAIRFANWKATQ